MPPARHPPPASPALTSLTSRCSSAVPSPISLFTPRRSLLPHSSPTRRKNRPKLSLASRHPQRGCRLARDSSPFTPAQITPSGAHPALTTSPSPDPVHPHSAHVHLLPPLPVGEGWGEGLLVQASRLTPVMSGPTPHAAIHPKTRPAAPPSSRRPQPGSSLPPAPPGPRKTHPRRASRVFWKKLLRAQTRPISPLQPPARQPCQTLHSCPP